MRLVKWPPEKPADEDQPAGGGASDPEPVRLDPPAKAPAPGTGPGDTISILVADDDPDIRVLLGAIVEREDGLVLAGSAADTAGAVDLARERSPDVVILDWMMPGGGGAKAAAEIGKALPSARIIGITAGDAAIAEYEMGTHGAVGFLQKGFAAAELVEAIRSALRW
jgi:DNA-binding NarL/FixJ family response regulator